MNNRVMSATLSLKLFESSALFLPSQKYTPQRSVSTHTPAISLAKTYEKTSKSFYTGSGKPAEKKPKFSSFKKAGPMTIIGGIVIAAVFMIFGSSTFLGSQLETLITRATDTMFGSYSETTLRITKELLAGKRGAFPDYFRNRLKAQGMDVSGSGSYSIDFNGTTVTADNFDSVYKNNIEFREGFSKAKRGRSANFFDNPAESTLSKFSVTRNIFKNHHQTGNAETDNANYKKTESEVFEAGTATKLNTVTEKEVTDDDGNTHTEKTKAGNDIDSSSTVGDSATIKAKNYLADISTRISETGGLACAALRVGNLLSAAIAVNYIYQAIHYFVSGQEPVSKTLFGLGEFSAMNQQLSHMTEVKTSTYIDAKTGEKKEITGSMLEGEGFATTLAGEKADIKKTKNHSVEAAFLTTGVAVGLTAANNKYCGGIRAVGAVVSLVSFAVSGALINSVISLAKTVIINAAIGATIATMLSALIPRIALVMFENKYEALEGIPGGEAYIAGADLLNKKLGRQAQGQLLATEDTATAYNIYTIAAAANEAELDRNGRSPFDISSPNTFLGSLVGKFAVLSGSSNLFSAAQSISSIVGSATSSLKNTFLASASASSSSLDGATILAIFENTKLNIDTTLSGTNYQTTFGDEETCQNLKSIGAACSMYGVEVTATSPLVLGNNFNASKYEQVLSENIEKNEDGFDVPKPNSLFEKKIKYCDNRDTPPGLLDANVLSDFETSLGIFDYFPALNDVVDIVNAAEDASDEAVNWATNLYCVMNESSNPYYEDLAYLQYYQEDQRVGAQIKLEDVTDSEGNDRTATTIYLEEYNKKNPLDTSDPIAVLSHYTGSTYEDAALACDIIDYLAFLDTYTPPTFSTLSSVFTPEKSEKTTVLPTFNDFVSIVLEKIKYNSLRNKNYAA